MDPLVRLNQLLCDPGAAITTSLISIDPGLNSMGWAYWRGGRVHDIITRNVDRPPTKVGLINAPRKMELRDRSLWIARELERETRTLGNMGGPISISECVIVSEFPEWMGIQLGWSAGDLQKLVFLVGVLAGYFSKAQGFVEVKPGEWKGQLPKSVVIKRLRKKFGSAAVQDWEKDVWDAVGIGMWAMGRF